MNDESNRCIFCGDLAILTSEHIWGEWLKDYIDLKANKHSTARIIVPAAGEALPPSIKQSAGDPVMAQVNNVCEGCNSGFLSQIQNRAIPYLIPLFEGQESQLSEAAQAIIASWIAMATMTAVYKIQYEHVAIPQSDRNWLRNTLTAPTNWRIWIGHCDTWQRKEQWLHVALPIFEAESPPDSASRENRLPNTQTTAFRVGKLFSFAMSSAFSEVPARWNWNSYTVAHLVLRGIWPTRHPFVVWPFVRMRDYDAENIARAFLAYCDQEALRETYL